MKVKVRTKKRMAACVMLLAFVLGNSVSANGAEDGRGEEMERINSYVCEQYSALSESEQKSLAEEIYQEKYAPAPSVYAEEPKDEEEFVNVAYEKMMEREQYIVELISSHSGRETTFEAWEYNLDYLKSNYEELMAQENVNAAYIDRYIEDYEIVQMTADLPLSRINNVRMPRTSYNSSDAVAYANKHWKNYNSNYPDWRDDGGDCANFVSQCLYAGGKAMKGTPGSKSEAENFANWFSSGSSCDTTKVSSTWRGADAFRWYWSSNSSAYKTFWSVDEESYDYGFVGDAVSLLNANGSAFHTLIIIGYNYYEKDFIVAAHSHETHTDLLSEYLAGASGFIIYNMR